MRVAGWPCGASTWLSGRSICGVLVRREGQRFDTNSELGTPNRPSANCAEGVLFDRFWCRSTLPRIAWYCVSIPFTGPHKYPKRACRGNRRAGTPSGLTLALRTTKRSYLPSFPRRVRRVEPAEPARIRGTDRRPCGAIFCELRYGRLPRGRSVARLTATTAKPS
jgi:hypothetical protein